MSIAISGVRVPEQSHSAQRTHMRITLRGKVTAALLALCMGVGIAALVTPDNADSASGAVAVTSYTVRPGDNLWNYASTITPAGQDVSQTVNELLDLNNLDSTVLVPGQRLLVPAE
ncbi:LysM peptidoglycan-binding domain-containing protein [Bifidobacterium sp.]|jgi:LysM repeat protein|uniref:LysM peptidoglycan-binding domain-containing protein n=1 Tax=Bifidobacterium sp. TaxID=41200 RepID=UPI0025B9CEE2|nr:LysM peptidoglycan-binding domain-containing protein [Bifidobacterium sp.]MCH4160897.1 LysM peptidoglycan-binding domain-containing protein [Bifidobacterium sp.]MCH4174715.1 LysM peptidoglycan-binding domain-containing protein [Bifidobacterium sp.]MCI1636139.1 LysM peptidoglycan-binding domain-containing protein [Bifidobacterium sp.]